MAQGGAPDAPLIEKRYLETKLRLVMGAAAAGAGVARSRRASRSRLVFAETPVLPSWRFSPGEPANVRGGRT